MSSTDFIPDAWKGRPVLRAEDLAPVLDVHKDDLYRMAKNHEIPSFKLGTRRLFRTAEIVRWLAGSAFLPEAA